MGLDQGLYLKHKKFEDGAAEVIYWRKVNCIHRYFTQDWEKNGYESDNCTEFPVCKKDLETLLEMIDEVLAKRDEDISKMLLPTMSGFFFGSTEYDDWYYNDLEDTKRELMQLLGEITDEDELFYSAWY